MPILKMNNLSHVFVGHVTNSSETRNVEMEEEEIKEKEGFDGSL